MRLNLRKATVLAGIVLGLAAAGPSSATLLNNPINFPLLSFDNGGVTTYSSASDSFRVDAFPIAIRFAPGTPPKFITPNPPDSGEFFTIAIGVDAAGNLEGAPTPNDLSVFGSIDVDGDGVIDITGLLLSGSVTGFGFQDNGGTTDQFDFTFATTGGALQGLFGASVGVSMQSEHSNFVGFETNFIGGAKGTLGVIPEPASLVLLGAGVSGLAFLGRKREA